MGAKAIRGPLVMVAAVIAATVWILAAPASAGGGCHLSATEATGTEVELKDMCFTPTILHVQPGQTITWTNVDDMQHVVAGQSGEWGNFEGLNRGQTLSYRFTKSGVYPYTCFLHPGMNGAVVVGDVKAPTGAVTAGGGVVAAPPSAQPQTAEPPASAVTFRPLPSASATPWKIAAGVGFGLFAMTLVALGLVVRPRRRKAVPVVA